MNMNGTETRQEYVQVSAGECVWIPITVLLSHINTVFEVKPTVWSHLNYYNCRKWKLENVILQEKVVAKEVFGLTSTPIAGKYTATQSFTLFQSLDRLVRQGVKNIQRGGGEIRCLWENTCWVAI